VPLILVLIAMGCGVVGLEVGRRRGHPGLGFWWGVLLGPPGWLLVAIGPDDRHDRRR